MLTADLATREMAARIVATATAMAGGAPTSILYGPNNRPLPFRPSSPEHALSRGAAKRTGSLKNWVPRRLTSRQQESFEREEISQRSSDLINNDPNAAGLCETFAMTAIGAGLQPHYCLDAEEVGLDKEQARVIKKQQLRNLREWWPMADAGGRMNFGQIQYLLKRNMFQFGEYLVLLPMLDEPSRPFSLACQVIHPLRLKTPADLINEPNIRDGVELGPYGEPVAYWIKKAASGRALYLTDASANFERIERKAGHRFRVLHNFIQRDPEQVRGVPEMAVAMKISRDLNDLLDAELVSNIVTAAFTMFIETTGDPYSTGLNLADTTETDANGKTTRYQEFEPGQIMYGNAGEKPHPIAASRPGTTFEPFTKLIKKSLALAVGLPYAVGFKDLDGVSYAGFRAAMLEAWRIFACHRQWMGDDFCQPINTMLQEEAWLRNRLAVPNFYRHAAALTAAQWRGAPKGDIDPKSAAETDILEINANLKTHEQALAERGNQDFRSIADQLQEEWEVVEQNDLPDARTAPVPGAPAPVAKPDKLKGPDQKQQGDEDA